MKRTINRWENASNGEVYFSYTCAQRCGDEQFAYVKVKFGRECPRIPQQKKFVIDTKSENLKFKLGEFEGKKIAILDTIWVNDFTIPGAEPEKDVEEMFQAVAEQIPF